MLYLLIFYIAFSGFFMLGYARRSKKVTWWQEILGYLILITTAPIMFPYNLGNFIYDNQR